MICPKCQNEGFIIHHYVPFNPGHEYTEDCPLRCDAQQKLRALIDARKKREEKKCAECGSAAESEFCQDCCEHEYDADEGFMCLGCGKEGAEEVMSRAYDRAKDLRKYGE